MTGRRLLNRYLRETKQGPRDFSRVSGFDVAMISRWRRGLRRPGIDSAAKLERVTGGKVPAAAWVNGNGRAA